VHGNSESSLDFFSALDELSVRARPRRGLPDGALMQTITDSVILTF
jgi:hypothetical protein